MKVKILLFLICLLFIFTRLYKISEVPPSVYWDEASIGYNAFSVSQTGYDEWGDFFPLHFRAFGEFKLPVFIYTTIPFIKLFGLNALSIRAPAVLFSLAVVIITFFLAKRISGSSHVGLWSSLFITISPGFFIISRVGYEATAGLMFYLLGIYASLLVSNKWSIFISILFFVLSIYSYNSFRVISPLTILILLLFQRGNLKKILKRQFLGIIFSAVFLIVAALPIYRLYKYDAGISRLEVVHSSFAKFLPNYISHFKFDYLFINGDKNLRSQQANFGQLSLLEFILIPAGLLYIFKKKLWILLPFILIAPIPAALTKESPHALRSLSFIPFASIISAFGLAAFKKYFPRKFFVESTTIAIALLLFFFYFISFVEIYPKQSSSDWQLGYKKIFTEYKNKFAGFNHVIISNQYAQPYIFGLYYLKYDPNQFRKEVSRNTVDQWGFSTISSFSNFIFTKVAFNDLPKGKNLIFTTQNDKLKKIPYKDVILNLDNSVAFYVYEYEK